jgi:signal transduction histidine kinase
VPSPWTSTIRPPSPGETVQRDAPPGRYESGAARSAAGYHGPPAAPAGPGRGSTIRTPTAEEQRLARALERAERRLAETAGELERLRERLAVEVSEREELVAVVSHELRTPLTVIAGFNKLLLSERVGPLTGEQRRFLTESERSCRRLDAFIGNLIEAARQAAAEGPLPLCEASLEASVRGVVESLRPLLEQRGLRAELRLDPAAARARFHPLRIEQVLTNLIGNAIRYAAKGGCIELETRAVGDRVEIAVSDDGPGVPAAEREQIFRPWVRGGDPREGGLGLGLAICKRIVEAHGGTIAVGDAPRGGSRFCFTLPLAAALARVAEGGR